jgi:protein FRA10AC1
MRYMNPYDIHKALINDYVLKRPGDTKLLQRDGSKDRTDHDVLRQNHRFLWDESTPDTWEAQFAKKYYDKLFKEYCIGDLSLFKDNKVSLYPCDVTNSFCLEFCAQMLILKSN